MEGDTSGFIKKQAKFGKTTYIRVACCMPSEEGSIDLHGQSHRGSRKRFLGTFVIISMRGEERQTSEQEKYDLTVGDAREER